MQRPVKPMFRMRSGRQATDELCGVRKAQPSRARVIRVTYSISHTANNCPCRKSPDGVLVSLARESAIAQKSCRTVLQEWVCARQVGGVYPTARDAAQTCSTLPSLLSRNSLDTNMPRRVEFGSGTSTVRCRRCLGGPTQFAL